MADGLEAVQHYEDDIASAGCADYLQTISMSHRRIWMHAVYVPSNWSQQILPQLGSPKRGLSLEELAHAWGEWGQQGGRMVSVKGVAMEGQRLSLRVNCNDNGKSRISVSRDERLATTSCPIGHHYCNYIPTSMQVQPTCGSIIRIA